MPRFPSREWIQQLLDLFDADPERALATAGWSGDFGLVVDADVAELDRPFVVHLTPEGGRLRRFEVLQDPDELDVLEPAYYARAPYSAWKGLLLGTADPVELLIRRKLQVRGDLEQLVERSRFKGAAERVLAQLETVFPDD